MICVARLSASAQDLVELTAGIVRDRPISGLGVDRPLPPGVGLGDHIDKTGPAVAAFSKKSSTALRSYPCRASGRAGGCSVLA